MSTTNSSSHRWRFWRAGGVDQVALERADDLVALPQLDQKLWVALACPTRGVEFDPKTLAAIDRDGDGRIRARDVLQAVRWACERLTDPQLLATPNAELPIAAIDERRPEGQRLRQAATWVGTTLGLPDRASLSADQVVAARALLVRQPHNGDGVVPAAASLDPEVAAAMADILGCTAAPATDRSGDPGLTRALMEQFVQDAKAWLAWLDRADAEPALVPLGPATATAVAVIDEVAAKVDDYFARCALAGFDGAANSALLPSSVRAGTPVPTLLSLGSDALRDLPLAAVTPQAALPVTTGLNPAWGDAMARLQSAVILPLLGPQDAIAQSHWRHIVATFGPYRAWMAAKPGGTFEVLGAQRVRALLAGPYLKIVDAMISADLARQPAFEALDELESLARLRRDLLAFVNNFVSFQAFYGRSEPAMFQVGTLFLDQRSCDLVLAVDDPSKHATMAGLAGICLVYCDCVRKATGENRQIVAAITDGDVGNLMVGKNGVFYDRQGRDWDATVTKIIDNPISLRQAFWAPYRKLARYIEEQVAKRAADADGAANARLTAAADRADPTAQKAPDKAAEKPPEKPAEPKKVDVGAVAALGVAVGAIGTALSAALTGLVQLPWWQLPVVFAGVVATISGPSVLLAWLKLRKRNIGPLLDANGWAINVQARVNVAFGRSLTALATLPAGASRDLRDPFADRRSPWPMALSALLFAAAVLAALSHLGWLELWQAKALPAVPPGR